MVALGPSFPHQMDTDDVRWSSGPHAPHRKRRERKSSGPHHPVVPRRLLCWQAQELAAPSGGSRFGISTLLGRRPRGASHTHASGGALPPIIPTGKERKGPDFPAAAPPHARHPHGTERPTKNQKKPKTNQEPGRTQPARRRNTGTQQSPHTPTRTEPRAAQQPQRRRHGAPGLPPPSEGRGPWMAKYILSNQKKKKTCGGERPRPPTHRVVIITLAFRPECKPLGPHRARVAKCDARRTDARRGHTRWRSRRGRPGGAPRSRRTLLPAPALPGGSVGGRLDNTAGASPPALSPLALGHAMRPTANRHKTPPNRAPRRVAAPRGLTQKHPLKRGAPGSATHHSGSTTAAKPT